MKNRKGYIDWKFIDGVYRVPIKDEPPEPPEGSGDGVVMAHVHDCLLWERWQRGLAAIKEEMSHSKHVEAGRLGGLGRESPAETTKKEWRTAAVKDRKNNPKKSKTEIAKTIARIHARKTGKKWAWRTVCTIIRPYI